MYNYVVTGYGPRNQGSFYVCANERRRYIVTSPLIGCAQAQNVPRATAHLCHFCSDAYIVGELTYAIIGSDKDLSPFRRQAIIWTNVDLLLIGHIATDAFPTKFVRYEYISTLTSNLLTPSKPFSTRQFIIREFKKLHSHLFMYFCFYTRICKTAIWFEMHHVTDVEKPVIFQTY